MLAIVIPYYKFTFLEATLQSLSLQTCQDFKVYIGDDASPENPSILLEKYKGKFDYVYYRFDNNLGGISLTQQWERCIALSGKEEWLMILGDDDVLGDNVVEEFYINLPEIEQQGSNVIRFASQVVDSEGKVITDVFVHPKLEKATDSFWRKFTGDTRSSLSEYIFSRDAYSKYGFKDYPLAWHSDDMAWLEFAEQKPIFSINNVVIKIKFSIESISGSKANKIQKSNAQAIFSMNIVSSKLTLFDKRKRLVLLYQAERSLKNSRPITQSEWFFFATAYCYNFSFLPMIKFLRRYIKHCISWTH
jgi:glycosyltransferase involved in cell wall biosynthesis